MRFRHIAALGAFALLAGCQDEVINPSVKSPGTDAPARTQLDAMFARAAAEFGVRADLLKAVSYEETRWSVGEPGHESDAPFQHGVMGLDAHQVPLAARLAGVPAEKIDTDVESGIRAGAALLAHYGQELGVSGPDLAGWAPAVARYASLGDERSQSVYVHDRVYATLRNGVQASNTQLRATLPGQQVGRPAFQRSASVSSAALAPDWPVAGTVSWPALDDEGTGGNRMQPRPTPLHMVVVHICGTYSYSSYTGCRSWLSTDRANTGNSSAHYVVDDAVNASGYVEVSQMVTEDSAAHHAGSPNYDCANNASILPENEIHCAEFANRWVNGFTIGIEQAGDGRQTRPAAQLSRTAALVCDITRDNRLPVDRQHIIGHADVSESRRGNLDGDPATGINGREYLEDPGAGFSWASFMDQVRQCRAREDVVLVDNNATYNLNDTDRDAVRGRFEASTSWSTGTSATDKYKTDYRYVSASPVTDGATFWFYLPAAATKTVSFWWTAGTNRSTSVPVISYNAAGTELGRLNVNQTLNGGKWNTIGTYAFTAGWNKVYISRYTTAAGTIIADAVRMQ
ncbi:MAG TPA: N-acetylmuramoyl-L-alanine amidase [Longimicrobium sp.]|jgi:N-acetyl-anhydromuramyl-L-alanine amidase AmpD